MRKVDIAIPIYNAYDYTVECINSIFRNTDLSTHTLMLINDKSPDEKILPMLKKVVEDNKDKNIILLDNEENMGFVKTVNRAMQESKNDIILLNSDTEVTPNWIEKIVECAYSNESIATVTPLTNNGTICSVPNFGIDNDLPDTMTLDEYSKMIEEISVSRYPQLTTGNGFCMYIKRSVINELGLFDDETFGKGYGEENDFCYRALDHGYTNVLCDNTFIYHKGTQSFKKENLTQSRAALIDEHMKLLTKKHPIYVQKTDQFIANNPLRDIQENIYINTMLHNKKKILYLVNEWKEDMVMTGGTSLHLKDLILKNRDEDIASFVLAPDPLDLTRFKLYLYTEKIAKEIFNFKTDINQYGQVVYTNNTYKEMIEKLFDTFKFDILHVHHFLFQSFDAIYVAKKRNVYSIITLHDLYMSCPSINMVFNDKYCENNPKRDCALCLKRRLGVNSDFLANWRRKCENVLSMFDKVIVPSKDTKFQFEKVYKNLYIEVVEHGVNVINVKDIKPKTGKSTFDIAFVGAMAPHKGSNILKSLIKTNNNSKIKIHLIGKSEDEELKKNKFGYVYHGQYERGMLPKLLKKYDIDLVCILATWPETYSYTLTETYMASVPVLTFDLGAVAQRVKDDKLGWTLPLESTSKEILEKIRSIFENKEDYESIKANFKKYKFKTVEEMQDYYIDMYKVVKASSNTAVSLYDLFNYRYKTSSFEFDQYRALYAHVVARYERARATKMWQTGKKIKRVFRKK